jgi:hypothetical protein
MCKDLGPGDLGDAWTRFEAGQWGVPDEKTLVRGLGLADVVCVFLDEE